MERRNRVLVLTIIFIIPGLVWRFKSQESVVRNEISKSEKSSKIKKKRDTSVKADRSPASTTPSQKKLSTAFNIHRNEIGSPSTQVYDPPEALNDDYSSSESLNSNDNYDSLHDDNSHEVARDYRVYNAPTVPANNPSSSDQQSPDNLGNPQVFGPFNAPVDTKLDTTMSGFGSTSSGSEELECRASPGGGSYSSPQNVYLSCSNSASIRYCLSENFCCDPDSGFHYSSPVRVGAEPKTYCLSFKGHAINGSRVSETVEIVYSFNPIYPNFQVATQRTYFQTTELEGLMSYTSSDFGKNFYSTGVLNLKSHNPGVSGLNWSCENIYLDHTSLSSPTTAAIIAEMSATMLSPSSQVDVTLGASTLTYGDNYVMAYVSNNSYDTPLVSCSTNKMTLFDFPYFEVNPSHGVAGTNQTRVFSGGFTHQGFFEPEVSVYRGPAGSSVENSNNKTLKTGLFSIFY